MAKGEPNLLPLFALTAGTGYAIGKGMQVLAPAVGEAVGSAIREGVNAKRFRDWQVAVEAKLDEVNQLLAELNYQSSTELAGFHDLQVRATARHFLCSNSRDRALDQETVFEAYDMLDNLAAELRAVIRNNRKDLDAAFNARIDREIRELLE